MFNAVVLMTEHVPCACTEATRIVVGSHSVPVGPVTVVFAVAILLFAPAALYGRIRRVLEARAMRAVLAESGASVRHERNDDA